MASQKLIGLVLMAVGVVLLYFGWQGSESLGDQVTEAVTGRFTDETMWYIFGGIAALVGGVFMAFIRK